MLPNPGGFGMLATLRKIFGVIIGAVQKVVLAVSLFLVYFAGIGITWVPVMLFGRGTLRRTPPDQDSFWVNAEGYEPDMESARRQT